MKNFNLYTICGFLVLISGCHKTELPASDDTSVNTDHKVLAEDISEVQVDSKSDKQDVVDNSESQKLQQIDDSKERVGSNETNKIIPFKTKFSTPEFPEIVTSVTNTETSWGTTERTTLQWYDDIEIYYEMPVFKSEMPASEKINSIMKTNKDSFFSKTSLEAPWQYEYERHQDSDEVMEDKYQFNYRYNNLQITDKYISFTMNMEWYMGGVYDYGAVPYAFDLSGEPIKLSSLYKKSDSDIKKMVIKAVKKYVDENGSGEFIEWDNLNKIDQFNFYIDNDIPHVTFKKYEIAAGAAGAFDIPLPKPQ